MTKPDINSDTWQQVSRWAVDQRRGLVEQLIVGSVSDNKLRGRIEQIDALLSLAHGPDPDIPSPEY